MMNKYYQQIPGWFEDLEADCLWDLANKTTGSILEVGFFFGRSTSVICDAIANKNIEFDSYDINFKTQEQFVEFYNQIHGSVQYNELLNKYVFATNKSVLQVATEHLSRYNLLQYVNLHCENFHTIIDKQYELIFCDATHDEKEIRSNLSKIISLSKPDCIWAFHDVGYRPDLIDMVVGPNIQLIKIVESLGVFQFKQ